MCVWGSILLVRVLESKRTCIRVLLWLLCHLVVCIFVVAVGSIWLRRKVFFYLLCQGSVVLCLWLWDVEWVILWAPLDLVLLLSVGGWFCNCGFSGISIGCWSGTVLISRLWSLVMWYVLFADGEERLFWCMFVSSFAAGCFFCNYHSLIVFSVGWACFFPSVFCMLVAWQEGFFEFCVVI